MTDPTPTQAESLRAQADAMESRFGAPSSASAALRMAAGYSSTVERSDDERAQAIQDAADANAAQRRAFGQRPIA